MGDDADNQEPAGDDVTTRVDGPVGDNKEDEDEVRVAAAMAALSTASGSDATIES